MYSDEELKRHIKLIIEMHPNPHVSPNIIATKIIINHLEDGSATRYKLNDPPMNRLTDKETGSRKRRTKTTSSGNCR